MDMLLFYILTMTCMVMVNSNNHFYKMHKSVPRSDFMKVGKAPEHFHHEVIFSIKQHNITTLETLLMQRTNLDHIDYRQWLSYEEITEITENSMGVREVIQWLNFHKIEILSTSNNFNYIKAIARIDKWEEILDTEFFIFKDLSYTGIVETEATARTEENTGEGGDVYIRAIEYSIPYSLHAHIAAVFNTVQTPPKLSYKQQNNNIHASNIYTSTYTDNRERKLSTTARKVITIDILKELYNITSTQGDAAQTQAVFAMANEHYSTVDLQSFQEHNNLTQQAALHPYGYNVTYCNASLHQRCTEGNLNIQYMMGISQHTETIYWYVNTTHDPFVAWITAVADMIEPPLVHTLSWGAEEQAQSMETMDAFNTEALKLALMGVTVLVFSGDNGVVNFPGQCAAASGNADQGHWQGSTNWTGKGYFPIFPATSPYVTAVGATMGPENGDPEVACQSQLGGVITTGGGFSTYYAQPSWQTPAVTQYFGNLTTHQQPSAGYNPAGRAYPDVAMIGVNYQLIVNNEFSTYYGTAASVTVFAGMISLVNAARAAEGLSSVGFLNPSLYSASSLHFHDILLGNNSCLAMEDANTTSATYCCESGFLATAEWDPVTGRGSITLPQLLALIASTDKISSDDSNDTGDESIVEQLGGVGSFVGLIVGGVFGLLLMLAVVFMAFSWCRKAQESMEKPSSLQRHHYLRAGTGEIQYRQSQPIDHHL